MAEQLNLFNKKNVEEATGGVKDLGKAVAGLEKPLENVAKSFGKIFDKSKDILKNVDNIKKTE